MEILFFMLTKNKKERLPIILAVICAAAVAIGQLTIGIGKLVASAAAAGTVSIGGSVVYGGIILAAMAAAIGAIYSFSKYKFSAEIYVFLGAVLRIALLYFWYIEPVSDFAVTYSLAHTLDEIPITQWKEVMDSIGTPYNNEWSAHLPFVLYQTAALKFFGGTVLSIQLVNVMCAILTCVFGGCAAHELFGKRAGRFTAGILSLNPLMLMFMPVLTNQHSALMFLTLAMWVYAKKPFKNKYANAALAGVFCAVSHLLRPEMYIAVIAVCIYFAILAIDDADWKHILCAAVYVCVFFGILFAADAVFQNTLTNRSILSGNLKYKIVVGLNEESGGLWNAEDGALVNNEEELDDAFSERIRSVSPRLLVKKALYQISDFVYGWILKYDTHPKQSRLAGTCAGAYMMCVMVLCAENVFKRRRERSVWLLSLIILCFMGVFAIIEIQSRYNYFIMSVSAVLAGGFTMPERSSYSEMDKSLKI